MMPLIIRGLIIYFVIVVSVRIMGKRQIGELQPSELVITILLSQIASLPLEDSEKPLIQCLLSIFLLVSLELFSSVIAMKSAVFRNILQGNSIPVIREGNFIEKNLKRLRFSVEDVLEALRLKDVFDIGDVNYGYIETNGDLSVKLKDDKEPLTLSALNIKKESEPLPCLIVCDGKIIKRNLLLCSLTEEKLQNLLKRKGVLADEILIMTYSKDGKTYIMKKES